jgi:hypothetical protein
MRIINCCHPNLNQNSSNANKNLSDDITTEIVVETSPIIILSANPNRKIIKIYTVGFSTSQTQLWLRYGNNITANNSSFPLLVRHLLIETYQANKTLSAICVGGTATLRVTVVNKV